MKNNKIQIIHDTIYTSVDTLQQSARNSDGSFRSLLSAVQIPEWVIFCLWAIGIIAALVISYLALSFAFGLLRASILFLSNFIKAASSFLFFAASESVLHFWQLVNHHIIKLQYKIQESRKHRVTQFDAKKIEIEAKRLAAHEIEVQNRKNELIKEMLKESSNKSALFLTEDEIKQSTIFAVYMDAVTLEEWKLLYLKDTSGISFDAFVSKNLSKIAMSQTFTGQLKEQ